jgi:hypothetical protein
MPVSTELQGAGVSVALIDSSSSAVRVYNPNAACMMVLHLRVMGFQVQASPFGVVTPTGRGANTGSLAGRLLRWLGRHTGAIV